MKKKKRSISPFNLSFLDIMFCGFGAVVLLVLIINATIIKDNNKVYEDLTGEVDQVELEITAAKQYLRNLKEMRANNQGEQETIINDIAEMEANIAKIEQKNQLNKDQSMALKEHINALQNDLKRIEKKNWLEKKKIAADINKSGNKVRQYEGDGNRQYLTGLKLGGRRVAIILDNSASMLDETIVNIIIKRNMSKAIKQSTRKWQQAINIVRWLVANLPKDSKVLLFNFNETIQPLTNNQSMQWVQSQNETGVNTMINHLFELVPEKGTNLSKVFYAIKKMKIKPDNIILITDGLPTQGHKKTNKTKIDAVERIDLFKQAIKNLPKKIPVNTILLPMEGDPMAASLYWKLAIDTNGSFLTPSRDWP